VGLIQRNIELEGISSISITLSEEITKKIRPPRALYPGFPLGHPIAFPGQKPLQLEVLRFLLNCLEELDSPGSIIKYDFTASAAASSNILT